MERASSTEEIVAYGRGELLGRVLIHKITVNNFHYLTIWTPVKGNNIDRLCSFVKSAEYGDYDYESLKKRVIEEEKWIMAVK